MPTQKLKIGFFTDTYASQINGVVSSIESFRIELEKQGHDVYVFAPKMKPEQKETDKIIRFRAFKFIFQPEYYVSVPFTRQIIKKFWKKELDIVHTHTPFSLGNLGYYYSAVKKVPLVSTYHTLYPEYVKAYILQGKVLTPNMVKKLSAIFHNRCDLTIAPSEKIKKLLKSYGVKTKIESLPTGINLNNFKKTQTNNFRKKNKIGPDDKVLLYVGRVAQEKNIDFLIKSFESISQQKQDVKLIIAGDGPHKKALKLLSKKLGLEKKVIFTGYLHKEDVVKAYYSSDIFVFASKTDTQGMVILEAAACGLPIVAVKDEAFADILKNKENGFTTGENKNIFADKIIKLLEEDILYRQMSSASKQIANDFTIEKQTNKLLEFYNKLI